MGYEYSRLGKKAVDWNTVMENKKSVAGYRRDIDGLRAIAVLSVVFYHYGLTSLRGGFIGVDIFFVISGYLITGIIAREIDEKRFSFVNFYERRIRRIMPALIGMLVPTLAIGTWLLLPSDLVKLGNGAIATLIFGANFLYWRQSGYFDSSSEYNPLLHTWSLAIEEQFYIFFPIVLILLYRFAKKRIKLILTVFTAASFILCVWVQALRPTAAFFLAPFRAWELLVGGLLALGIFPLVAHRLLREVLSLLALLTLLGSLLLIEAGPEFPGWQAGIPVLATALLLHTGLRGYSVVSGLLSKSPFVFIGKISYSLYLWHWPIIVYVNYFNAMESLPPHLSWLFMGIAIFIASVSYRWVEAPFRRMNVHGQLPPSLKFFFGTALVVMIGIAFSLALKIDDGWKNRFNEEVLAYDDARRPFIPFEKCDGRSPSIEDTKCALGAMKTNSRNLLWGDSHALAWAPAIDQIAKAQGSKVELALHSACPPLIGVKNPISFNCYRFNNSVLDYIKSTKIDTVFLVASWLSYSIPKGQYSTFDEYGAYGNEVVFAPAINRTIDFLSDHVRRIILIGPTPGAPDDIPFRLAMVQYRKINRPEEIPAQEFREKSAYFWEAVKPSVSRVSIVDPAKWFCFESRCKYSDSDFGLLYRDGGHLSLNGAKFVEKYLSEATGH